MSVNDKRLFMHTVSTSTMQWTLMIVQKTVCTQSEVNNRKIVN